MTLANSNSITKNTNNNPTAHHDILDEMAQRLAVMKRQEDSVLYRDYFQQDNDKDESNNHREDINEDCRAKMFEWIIEVVELCEYSRETVEIAMSYLDRFFSLSARIESLSQFQLAAMTSLYLAVKLFEPLKVQVMDVARLSNGEYTARQVSQMERCILKTLQWRMHGPPTKWSWALQVLALCGDCLASNGMDPLCLMRVQQLTLIQTQVAVGDYRFWQRQLRPSAVAMASFWNALRVVGASADQTTACLHRLQRCGGVDPISYAVSEAQARLVDCIGSVMTHLPPREPLSSGGGETPSPNDDDDDTTAENASLLLSHWEWNNVPSRRASSSHSPTQLLQEQTSSKPSLSVTSTSSSSPVCVSLRTAATRTTSGKRGNARQPQDRHERKLRRGN